MSVSLMYSIVVLVLIVFIVGLHLVTICMFGLNDINIMFWSIRLSLFYYFLFELVFFVYFFFFLFKQKTAYEMRISDWSSDVCSSDLKGLWLAAIDDDDPVLFFEPKRLYNGPFDGHHDKPIRPWAQHPASEVPDGHYTVPLGQAAIAREGSDVTVLAYGTMVHVALATMEETGIDGEVVDLRTLMPLDLETIKRSVRKTGRCVVIHEATRTCGFGAELAALVQEHCFFELEAPVERVKIGRAHV